MFHCSMMTMKSRIGSTEACGIVLISLVVIMFLYMSSSMRYDTHQNLLLSSSTILSTSSSSTRRTSRSSFTTSSSSNSNSRSNNYKASDSDNNTIHNDDNDLSPLSLIRRCNESVTESYSSNDEFTLRSSYLSTETTNNNNEDGMPIVLRDYAQWHAAERRCLQRDGLACDGSLPRVLVWRCMTVLCGGLGDRMRGIRFVFLLSVGLRRLFFIDWPVREASPYPLTIGLLPACIDWRYPTAESMALSMRADVVNTSVVYVVGGGDAEVVSAPGHGGGRDVSEKWMNNHSVPVIMTGMPNEIDFEDAWKHVHIVYLTNRSGRNSLLQLCENRQNTLLAQRLHGINGTEMSLLKLEQMLMQLLFIPSDIVRRLAHKRVTGNGNGLRKYIAVHARTGVDIGEGRNKRLGYIATHLAEAAERLYRCVRNTTTTTAASSNEKINVFLASDSNELKTRFLDLASTANDVTMEVMTDFRRSLHIDRRTSARKVRKDRMYSADEDKWMQVKWTYDDSGTDKKKRKIKKVKDDGNICLGFFDVFADVFALAQAESLVQFPSGFAVTAQTFGRHKIVRELTGLNEEDEEDDNKDECV